MLNLTKQFLESDLAMGLGMLALVGILSLIDRVRKVARKHPPKGDSK